MAGGHRNRLTRRNGPGQCRSKLSPRPAVRPGIPLALTFAVSQISGRACAPLAAATVEYGTAGLRLQNLILWLASTDTGRTGSPQGGSHGKGCSDGYRFTAIHRCSAGDHYCQHRLASVLGGCQTLFDWDRAVLQDCSAWMKLWSIVFARVILIACAPVYVTVLAAAWCCSLRRPDSPGADKTMIVRRLRGPCETSQWLTSLA